MTSTLFGDPPTEGKRSLLPLLPLRDMIVFPHMVKPLFVGRARSIAALEEAMSKDRQIMLAMQVDAEIDEPGEEDIHRIGVEARIIQLLTLPDQTVKVLVEGQHRARIREYLPHTDYLLAYAEQLPPIPATGVEIEALMRGVKKQFENLARIDRRIPKDVPAGVKDIEDAGQLADSLAPYLNLKLKKKQELLEMLDAEERLEEVYNLIGGEIEILQVERRIRSRVRKQIESSQKENYLNEQMRAIKKELGDRDEFKTELRDLEEKIKKKKMSDEAVEKVKAEMKKLRMMSPLSAEAAVIRNYIETMIGLPWYEVTELDIDIDEAAHILDEDHYGLDKVKERILEFLAVQKLVKALKGPILCLVGPPGVGKTSVGKSVARAAGRKFVRMSLGGVRDEAEIRGHRRTYIGSLPGKIMTQLKRAGVNNPVFMLDEVDKMSADYRGDPTSALLEVLDPEQNHAFSDHFLDVDYDLSQVMFIATANTTQAIPPALKDRMEIIRLPGYTEDEKLAIARSFLVPKQKEANGLKEKDLAFQDAALLLIIRHYTREAGVRGLEREIASICRKIARHFARKDHENDHIRITEKRVQKLLGVFRFTEQKREDRDLIGIANGLAWTDAGGELLSAEVAVMPGKGKLTATGSLGEVMKESAKAALSYIRRRSRHLELKDDFYQKVDIHIHFPEGAIPKDGPSAGIAIATALASALLNVPVRCTVAMTGEITLRGRVLAIGGLKEKIIAARRHKIEKVIIPRENEKDLQEIQPAILKGLDVVLVDSVDEVLRHALSLEKSAELFLGPPAEELPESLEEPVAEPGGDRTARLL